MPERRKLTQGDLEWMNLPPEYWRATVAGIPASVNAAVLRYLMNVHAYARRPLGLLLTGEPGVGKTGIASLIAKEARSFEVPTYFTAVSELREAIRVRATVDTLQPVLARCREVQLLVLDGLRAEDGPSMFFGAREIEDLLAARNSYKRATIVTTRVPADKLQSVFPGLMVHILAGAVPLEVTGPDQRVVQQQVLRTELLAPGKK